MVKTSTIQWVMRWTLSVALAAVSLFFAFSGLVTGLFATGASADDIGLLWQNQARFRLALASTFWLAAVFVFLSLRRGSALGILKRDETSVLKKWFYLMIIGFSLIIAVVSWVDVLKSGIPTAF
jgi:hypothetical protein